MTTLTLAIERQMWSLVALYLLLGVTQAATQLPPETLAALLEALEGPEAGGE
jgi:hypothetical protein